MLQNTNDGENMSLGPIGVALAALATAGVGVMAGDVAFLNQTVTVPLWAVVVLILAVAFPFGEVMAYGRAYVESKTESVDSS